MSIAGKKLLVFVSSTYVDLQKERQAAVEAILKAGHIPAGMELFTAGSKSQLQTIYNWIDQSDLYMLILGGRYGSLEPDSLISYVELEYDYAINKGMPVFAVVIDEGAIEEKVKAQGTQVIERENKKQYDQFREKVLSRISSFFSDEKDIKLSVHESLGDYRLDPSLSGWVSGKDIPDASPLIAEIERLKAENEDLLKKLSSSAGKRGEPDDNFFELTELLEATEIKVPKKLIRNADEDQTMSVYDLLLRTQNSVVVGVTNSGTASDLSKFLYSSLMPKLQVHGLAENDKVTGVAYRRSFLNEKGKRYLAWIDKQRLDQQRRDLPGVE